MKTLKALVGIVSLVLFVTPLFADPGGQVGRTLPTSSGCGGSGCHGTTKNTATTVSLQGASTVTMTTNETRDFTIIVAHASRPGAGFNVSVKASTTAQTNAGMMSVVSGQGVRSIGGELTQSSAKAMSGGMATFSFRWKAPATAGTYYMCAVGNAVNNNGRNDANDLWNFMTPIAITVQVPSSVAEAASAAITALASPLPSTGTVSFAYPSDAGETFEVAISDMGGQRIFAGSVTAESENALFTWNGTTPEGLPAQNGVYLITMISDRRTVRSRAVIVR